MKKSHWLPVIGHMEVKSGLFVIFLSFVICNLSFVISPKASAQSPTTKATPKSTKALATVTSEETDTASDTSVSATPADDVIKKLKQIESLKEKIATKVAQLREKEKGALSGIIKKIDKDRITVSARTDEKTFAFTDDITVYKLTDSSKTEIDKSKLQQEDHIAVFGYYNEDKSLLSAKYIYVENSPIRITGKIVDLDKSNFTITVHSKEGNDLLDIESYTKTNGYTATKGKAKIGFSKLAIGDIVHTVVTANTKEKDRYFALRILVIPGPIVPTATPTPKPTVEPSATRTPSATKVPKPTGTTAPTKTPKVSVTNTVTPTNKPA